MKKVLCQREGSREADAGKKKECSEELDFGEMLSAIGKYYPCDLVKGE